MKPASTVEEMVWPVEGYTDKLHFGLKTMFSTYHWLTFTVTQMESHLVKGYKWLSVDDDRQKVVLKKIITTGIRKLIQAGLVKKVSSNVSTESQWIAVKGVENSAYTSITSQDEVALTEAAKRAIKGRAVNAMDLWRLNQVPVTGSVQLRA
jgi:hypothetical protein